MSGGLLVGIGCVVVSTTTTVDLKDGRFIDHIQADIVAKPGCDHVEIELPPGVTLGEGRAKLKPADGGSKRLSSAFWSVGLRGLDGWATGTVQLPRLALGDRVVVEVERHHGVDAIYRWQPGRRGERFAELRVQPKDLDATAVEVNRERRGFWIDTPSPLAEVSLRLGAQGSAPPTTPIVDRPRTPAEALSAISRRHLVPDRLDLPQLAAHPSLITPGGVVREMTQGTGLVAAMVIDETHGDPVADVAVSTEPPIRVWAHPDQSWQADWTVSDNGIAAEVVGAPAGDGPSANALARVERTLTLQLPPGTDPRVALVPGAGSRLIVDERWHLRGPKNRPRVRLHTTGAGQRLESAVAPGATQSAVLLPPTRDQALMVAASGEDPTFVLRHAQADAPTCGRWAGEPDQTTIVAEGATVERDDTGWWVSGWNDRPMANERARVIASLAARFDRRALPEPGLPMRLRSRLRGWDLVAELPDLLRDRVIVAPLPQVPPTWPRRLYRARASGIATPLEAALILRTYALQAKVEADWVLVRSLEAEPGPELCAPTYDAALVRLRLDGEDRWLDPDCPACAPFEVRPELLGRPALGPWAERTPEPPTGQWMVRIEGRQVSWSLQGPAALELRRWVRQFPVSERKARLAERMAGAGATLDRVDGLQERGIAVTINATAASPGRIPSAIEVFTPPGGKIRWSGLRIWDQVGSKRTTALVKVGETGALQAFTDR